MKLGLKKYNGARTVIGILRFQKHETLAQIETRSNKIGSKKSNTAQIIVMLFMEDYISVDFQ